MQRRYFLGVILLLSLVGWGPFLFSSYSDDEINSPAWLNTQVRVINSQASNLDQNVLKLSLKAYQKARAKGLDRRGVLTIVDYSKPSNEKRLWVIDVRHAKVLFNTWVAHGKNSGSILATSFSNQASSLKSSLGVYVTESTYSGKHGYSLRVQGLERGINDHAYDRAVVVHGANYVSTNGRAAGRSWGCFAVNPGVVKPLIDAIKNQTLMIAYYPDKNWLKHSTYL